MKVFAREMLQFFYWIQLSLFNGILPVRGCYICVWFQLRVSEGNFLRKVCHIWVLYSIKSL